MAASSGKQKLRAKKKSSSVGDVETESVCKSIETVSISSNESQEDEIKTPAATKLIKSLQFRNPGPKEVFDPNKSNREMRKVMRTSAAIGKAKKKIVYNEHGLLQDSGRNLCDCLDQKCPGCHYPCPSCQSTKCGGECRCNRKWLYEQVEVEGLGTVHKFKR
ncbi:ARL14 effector protein-like [Antedon mediterranea]|uniref:ARL14 effector protein-like n=1 Tax=Antedon mediterranea TaxID=105859 RepID=UPI003AF64B7E